MKQFIMSLKTKSRKVLARKTKGEINYFLAIMIGAAILVLVGFPEVRKIVTSIFTTIATWWTTNIAKIFTNLP